MIDSVEDEGKVWEAADLTDQEQDAIIRAIWAQYIGMPLRRAK